MSENEIIVKDNIDYKPITLYKNEIKWIENKFDYDVSFWDIDLLFICSFFIAIILFLFLNITLNLTFIIISILALIIIFIVIYSLSRYNYKYRRIIKFRFSDKGLYLKYFNKQFFTQWKNIDTIYTKYTIEETIDNGILLKNGRKIKFVFLEDGLFNIISKEFKKYKS